MSKSTSCLLLVYVLAWTTPGRADIFRWDNGKVIPGTEGIQPGPRVRLDHRELEFASLSGLDLSDSRFDFSNLSSANLSQTTLFNANLTGAVMTGAISPARFWLARR